MAFCPTCGASVEGRFCAKCGSSVAAGAPAAGAGPSGPVYSPPDAGASAMADNVAGALCYSLGLITGILFLVLAPYNKNPNIKFHAFQSIFMSVGCILLSIVLGIVLSILLGMLHIFGLFFISALIRLGFFCLWIFMLLATYQGKKIVLPLIGPFAEQQARG